MSISFSPVEAKNALLAVMETTLATSSSTGGQVPTFYAWNPEVTDECAFLGRPVLAETDQTIGLTRITTTRLVAEAVRPANADYVIEGTCWSFRPDLTPDAAATAEARIDVLWPALEAAFGALSWVGEQTVEYQLRPFGKGWAAYAPFTVQVISLLS